MEEEDKIPPEYCCPITNSIMHNPVSTIDGYNFELSAIKKWLEKNDKSPMTNLPLKNKKLFPNNYLKNKIQKSKYYKPLPIPVPDFIYNSNFKYEDGDKGLFFLMYNDYTFTLLNDYKIEFDLLTVKLVSTNGAEPTIYFNFIEDKQVYSVYGNKNTKVEFAYVFYVRNFSQEYVVIIEEYIRFSIKLNGSKYSNFFELRNNIKQVLFQEIGLDYKKIASQLNSLSSLSSLSSHGTGTGTGTGV